ncbi:MAG TPA: hypothetical protein PKE17_18855 [Saprospiraceae bacterium]|nr:hypothetical protein [Saprospiraceae bacterium]
MTSCTTPYQRTGATGGYSDTRLQENVFTVNFRGNGYTSRERAQDFAMLRCADITIENGFRYFAIADSSADEKTMMYHSGGSSQTYGTMNTYGNTTYGNFNTYGSSGTSVPIRKPRASYTIFCFKEKPPETIMAFDAEFMANSIREKYKMKTEETQHEPPVQASPH